jgi:hypothetical protein
LRYPDSSGVLRRFSCIALVGLSLTICLPQVQELAFPLPTPPGGLRRRLSNFAPLPPIPQPTNPKPAALAAKPDLPAIPQPALASPGPDQGCCSLSICEFLNVSCIDMSCFPGPEIYRFDVVPWVRGTLRYVALTSFHGLEDVNFRTSRDCSCRHFQTYPCNFSQAKVVKQLLV